MKTEIIEFRKSIKKIAQEHLQEEEKLKQNFQNSSKKIISSIKGEREKLTQKTVSKTTFKPYSKNLSL